VNTRLSRLAAPIDRLAAVLRSFTDPVVSAPVTLLDSCLRVRAVLTATAFRTERLTCARHAIPLNEAGFCNRCAPDFRRVRRPVAPSHDR
jgi:hypothetical protein